MTALCGGVARLAGQPEEGTFNMTDPSIAADLAATRHEIGVLVAALGTGNSQLVPFLDALRRDAIVRLRERSIRLTAEADSRRFGGR